MDRRLSKRRSVNLECHLVSRSLNHVGTIENLSGSGMNVSIIPPLSDISIPYGMSFIVKFNEPSGKPIDIHCKVVRLFKSSIPGTARRIGMEVVTLTREYKEYLDKLH